MSPPDVLAPTPPGGVQTIVVVPTNQPTAFVQRLGSFVSAMVAMGSFLIWAGLMMLALAAFERRTARRARGPRAPPVGRGGSGLSRVRLLFSGASGGSFLGRKHSDGGADRGTKGVELVPPVPRAHSTFRV